MKTLQQTMEFIKQLFLNVVFDMPFLAFDGYPDDREDSTARSQTNNQHLENTQFLTALETSNDRINRRRNYF